jgi:hypothetical protein
MDYVKDIVGTLVVAAFAAMLFFIPDCPAEASVRKDKADKDRVDYVVYDHEWDSHEKEEVEADLTDFQFSVRDPADIPLPKIDPKDPFGFRRGLR